MPRNYVPKPKTKIMPCKYCGKPMTVGWKTKKIPNHVDCAIAIVIRQNHEMRNHSGMYYEDWRNRMIEFWSRQTPTSGGSPENVSHVSPDDA